MDTVVFGKEVIARRLQLTEDCITLLIEEYGMPTDSEEKFIEWGLTNFDLLWNQMKENGPIAQMERSSP